MRFNFTEYMVDIVEFLCRETLEEIDYGILDLSRINDYGLREVLLFFEELLSLELKINYLENSTGIFRVHIAEGRYFYEEFGYVLEADSVLELRELVLGEDRIWYVFDEYMAEKIIGGRGIN